MSRDQLRGRGWVGWRKLAHQGRRVSQVAVEDVDISRDGHDVAKRWQLVARLDASHVLSTRIGEHHLVALPTNSAWICTATAVACIADGSCERSCEWHDVREQSAMHSVGRAIKQWVRA